MRFFIFTIWVLTYGLPILPAGIFLTSSFPFVELPGEVVALLILPGSLYILLHSVKNRQGFNFIMANFLTAIPPTLALFALGLRQDWVKHTYLFMAISCVMVLLVWWKFPLRKNSIFF
jgi:hypothetical protein